MRVRYVTERLGQSEVGYLPSVGVILRYSKIGEYYILSLRQQKEFMLIEGDEASEPQIKFLSSLADWLQTKMRDSDEIFLDCISLKAYLNTEELPKAFPKWLEIPQHDMSIRSKAI